MPSFRLDQPRNPWVARVYLSGKNYILGSYPSRYLAYQEECRFKNELHLCQLEAYALWEAQLCSA